MKPALRPVFLARQSYRRRRLMDASRLLPVLGVFLFLLPLLHASGGFLVYLVYLFAAWLFLIGIAAGLAKSLSQSTLQSEDETGEGPV